MDLSKQRSGLKTDFTFRGHNRCGVNIMASVSGDILLLASLSATRRNNLNSLSRKLLCDGVSNNNNSCRAVKSLLSEDSAFGGYCPGIDNILLTILLQFILFMTKNN